MRGRAGSSIIPAMLLDPGDLGKAIGSLRGPRTQSEVAKQGGVPASQWSLYESGRRWPNDDTLAKIIKGLGCTEDILLDELLKARARRRGVAPASTAGRALGRFPEEVPGGSDLQPLLTELRSIRSHLSLLGTYVIGLERRVEQFLGEAPSSGAQSVQPS